MWSGKDWADPLGSGRPAPSPEPQPLQFYRASSGFATKRLICESLVTVGKSERTISFSKCVSQIIFVFTLNLVDEEKVQYSRSAVMINPVDLSSNEDADLAVLPPFLVSEQVGDEQGQTWKGD